MASNPSALKSVSQGCEGSAMAALVQSSGTESPASFNGSGFEAQPIRRKMEDNIKKR
jgi:hypothetical protein